MFVNVIGQHLLTVLWTNLDICDELANDHKPLVIIKFVDITEQHW